MGVYVKGVPLLPRHHLGVRIKYDATILELDRPCAVAGFHFRCKACPEHVKSGLEEFIILGSERLSRKSSGLLDTPLSRVFRGSAWHAIGLDWEKILEVRGGHALLYNQLPYGIRGQE